MDAVAARPGLELHGLVVLRDGATVLEQYWAPYVADDRVLVYSASKTFAATAVGLAIAEGRFGLDDRLVELFSEPVAAERVEIAGRVSTGSTSRVAGITVHHLLSMSTGHTEDTLPALEAVPPEQWASRLLQLPPQSPVGSRHVYNNGASWALGELIRRHTGEDLLDYLRSRLLEPLGIEATWDRDSLGRCLGWSGMHLTTRDLARMGELYRNDGVWDGRRLLPEGWVARATSKQIPTVEENPEWDFGYGYQLWLNREGYRLDGAYGQFSLVLPERGLVIAINSAQSGNQALLDLVWDELLPELDRSVDLDRSAEPAETRSDATLPVPPDSGLGTEWAATGPVPLDESLAETEEQEHLPELADLAARRAGGELRLAFTTAGQRTEVVATPGRWRRQSLRLGEVDVPVAVSAGAAEGSLHARLVFTDSPHTLRVRIGADGGSGLAWKVSPLQGSRLAALRAG